MHTGGNTGWYKIKSKRKLRDKYSNIVVTHLFLNLVHLIYRAGNQPGIDWTLILLMKLPPS